MMMVLSMTGHGELEIRMQMQEIERGLIVALAQIRAISAPDRHDQ